MAIAGFYSDPHFWHTNIIKYCSRPFGSIEEMNEELIDRYNETVGPTDEVWWLGDVSFSWKDGRTKAILDQMNGTKHLILGNHDQRQTKTALLEAGFASVQEQHEMEIGGTPAILCHYPYAGSTHDDRFTSRRPAFAGYRVLLHGHSHSRFENRVRLEPGLQIDCGVDGWNYGIAPMDEIEKIIAQKMNH